MEDLGRSELMRLFEAALGFFDEGVLIADNSGHIVFYNQAAGALEGLEPSLALGRHIDDLFLSESPVARALHDGLLGHVTDDLILTEFDERGRPVRIQVQCYPLRLQDRQVGVLRLTRDLALWVPELDEARALPNQMDTAHQEVQRLDDGEAVLCGTSKVAQELRQAIDRLHGTREPVMLWGSPGSGRSSLARLLHGQDERAGQLLTCDFHFRSATAQELLLCGVDSTPGLWRQARGGALVLENLHLASPRLQNRLVTMLAEQDAPRSLLILPGDPRDAVRRGLLHPGILERCVSVIPLASLQERSEDLPQICQYLLRRLNMRLDRRVFGLSPLAKEIVQRYPWPGGLRELHGVLEGAMLLVKGAVITPEHLPPQLSEAELAWEALQEPFEMNFDPVRFAAESQPLFEAFSQATAEEGRRPDDTQDSADEPAAHVIPSLPAPTKRRRMGELEKGMILDTLRLTGNDLPLTAKQLRMRESTLRKRLEQYQIHLPDEEEEEEE